MNKEQIDNYFYKDEFGNYIISEFEDLGFNMEFKELNLLTKSLNVIGKHIEQLQQENKELKNINKELYSRIDKGINWLERGELTFDIRKLKTEWDGTNTSEFVDEQELLSILKGDD